MLTDESSEGVDISKYSYTAPSVSTVINNLSNLIVIFMNFTYKYQHYNLDLKHLSFMDLFIQMKIKKINMIYKN